MIEAELISPIADRVERLGPSEATLSILRNSYPGIHFTYCMDDDIPNDQTMIERGVFNLYRVDEREQCVCLTSDPVAATGLVVAEKFE